MPHPVATAGPRRLRQVRISTLMTVVAITAAASWIAREIRSGETLSAGAQVVVGLGLPALGAATIIALVGLSIAVTWLAISACTGIAAAWARLRRMRS